LKEGKILTGYDKPEDIADFYLSQGVDVVVIKTGEQGAYYKTSENQKGIVPALRVKHVVDTVGAGDGFAVGVISALLEGESLQRAVERGNFVGARAIQVIGDSEGLPTKAQLQQEMSLLSPSTSPVFG
ncbi:MAG: carbohydrate kinase family protein, partial [Providencia sp.]